MKKILIVEDELAYMTLLHDKLTAAGYTVIEAVNGKLGLEKVKKEKPDLVILDVRMPVMDGMTMLDLLRKDEASKDTKVIILTNLEPDEKMIGKVVNDQPSYYFVKSDIHVSDLLEKIQELLAE